MKPSAGRMSSPKQLIRSKTITKIAIIGAGLSGLSLARALPKSADVTVFEKSRGIGGRMATRYAGDYEFDHGAQYFTVKSDAFSAALQDYQSADQVRIWPIEVAALGGARGSTSEKFIASPRMNTLPKAMAEGVDVRVKVQISKMTRDGDDWHLIDSEGETYGPYDWVISAAPAPQASALLPDMFTGHEALKAVRMQGCFTLMLGFKNAVTLPWPAARIAGKPVGWMAVNSDKPGRDNGQSVLIQSSNEWAEVHLEDDRDAVQAALLESASRLAGADLSGADHSALHRWRYAATPVPAAAAFLLDQENHLAACGDWCLGSRVEAAFTSGHKLGEALAELV